MTENSGDILCFGEVLWDSLESGLFPGGAPMNLAYHLARLGWPTWPVSAVGRDALGEELVARLGRWGVNTGLIGIHDDLPTGIVRVQLREGMPSYEIVENVAWDRIAAPATLPVADAGVRALLYGSLAQRSACNRDSLSRLMASCRGALKVFDVNLRPPFDDRARVLALAGKSDLIKVNDEELAFLLGERAAAASYPQQARQLATQTGCATVCLTAGALGAGLLIDGAWHWVDAEPVEVVDTIGAGDSFLAALVHGLLQGSRAPGEVLASAAALAAFVAASAGATPAWPDGLVS